MDTEFKYSPEEFKRFVEAYHKKIEERGEFPDVAGLKNALDIEDDEYDAMANDERYFKTIRWSRRRRESCLNRLAITARNTNGIKMLLAQPENGGYVEKPVKPQTKLEVILRGMPDDDDIDSDGADLESDSDDNADEPEQEDGVGKGQSSDSINKHRRGRGRPKRI